MLRPQSFASFLASIVHSLSFFLERSALFYGPNSLADIVRERQLAPVAQRSAENHIAASLAYQGVTLVAQAYAFLADPCENLAPIDFQGFTHHVDGLARILAQPFMSLNKQFIFLFETLRANRLIETREKRAASLAVTQ